VKRARAPMTTRGDSGFAMPALIAMLAIMALALLLAMPSWRYLVRDDKEQELIFRGRQISAAVARFQRKNGNALPASFEQLVKGKFLRQAYKDPMTADGKWRILRPGEGIPGRPGGPGFPGGPGSPPGGGKPTPTPSPSPTPIFGGNSGGPSGPIAGVASLSTEVGIRVVNGVANYNLWIFAPNVPFIVGGQPIGGRPPAGGNQAPPAPNLRAPDAEMPRISR
jgi:type II secretory pathway pseudopilin PulG